MEQRIVQPGKEMKSLHFICVFVSMSLDFVGVQISMMQWLLNYITDSGTRK